MRDTEPLGGSLPAPPTPASHGSTRRAFLAAVTTTALAACADTRPPFERRPRRPASPRAGDFLLTNGPIYTGDRARPMVEALRVRAGRVVFLGSKDDAAAGPGRPRLVDLQGAAAFPGFTDCHVHLLGVGLRDLQLDLTGVAGIMEFRARLAAYAREHAGPIVGRGWIETHWPERRFPRAADIDDLTGDRPVLLTRADGHAALANSAALALAGIGSGSTAPAGGAIERDSDGRATGMLIDNAVGLVAARMPAPDEALRRRALRAALALYAKRGWVGGHDMGVRAGDYAILREFDAAGETPLRIDAYLAAADAEHVFAPGGGLGVVRAEPGDVRPKVPPRLALRGVKYYVDGALGSRGAALLAPYSDSPGASGLLVTPPEILAAAFARARRAQVQIALHAIGDRANRLALDLFAETYTDAPAGALAAARWRIEHAQILAPEDIGRFARLGITASMQPSHAIGDLYFAPARLGLDRLNGAYAWRSLLESGALVVGGSDAPVERGDPLVEFYAAAYRHDLTGKAGPEWGLDQALARADALDLFTLKAARATFRERDSGRLAPGLAADVSVFSADLMRAPFTEIAGAEAVLTMSGGAITHNSLDDKGA